MCRRQASGVRTPPWPRSWSQAPPPPPPFCGDHGRGARAVVSGMVPELVPPLVPGGGSCVGHALVPGGWSQRTWPPASEERGAGKVPHGGKFRGWSTTLPPYFLERVFRALFSWADLALSEIHAMAEATSMTDAGLMQALREDCVQLEALRHLPPAY